jgi:putative cardiolipin synthase
VGPVVRDLSAVFDRFWNSASAVPISALVDREYNQADLDALVEGLNEWLDGIEYPYPIEQDLDYLDRVAAEIRAGLVWAPGRIISDHPDALADGESATDVANFLTSRTGQVEDELLIESPYFVLRDFGIDLTGELVDRGVRVQILTNSLASNDVLPVHAGYAKTRRRLLENGVELYEMRADTEDFRPGWSFVAGGSRSALHAKALAFDREAVFIGSYNLDPRSADINTEAGLYIESPELAEQLAAWMAQAVAPDNSYHVTLDRDGNLVWETEKDGEMVRYDDEPDTGFRRRFVVDLLKILPLESQL